MKAVLNLFKVRIGVAIALAAAAGLAVERGSAKVGFLEGLTLVLAVLFRRELMFPTMAKWQPYVFGLGMSAVSLFLMGAGTLGVPRRHWDIGFAGNLFPHEFPGAAWLMMALAGIAGLVAIVGGGMYLLITVYSVFLGKRIATPEFKHVRARDGVAPAPRPISAAITGHGTLGMGGLVAPGTFALAMVFLVSFVLYYFINWKYLATVWPLK
jgi:cytochrome c oxidase subunit 1